MQAHRCLLRAARLAPEDMGLLYNLAAAEIALGRLADAEARLDQVIARNPSDYDAYYNRATLRRQTPLRNHVAQLETTLSKAGTRGEVPLCYALAKELEDLGEHARAFRYLARGAAARRRQLSYRVEHDLETLDAIIANFDAALLAKRPSRATPDGPIFVIGLPRSGTTLVDRILSSHPQVESFGELNDLPLAVMQAAGAAPDRLTLVRQSAHCDHAALGRDYLARVDGYGRTKPRFVDKTPLNLLYLGLIALALPGARVVHLCRDPLDACYAMYKTLFRMGYPFSYDFTDLARYYAGYERLMQHWRKVLPGGFHELQYEALVASQETTTRTLLEACGLDFDPACLAFHENPAAVATASAAQVREPLHARSVGALRHYAAELAPLREALIAEGIDVQ
ncbi:MAG: sulfotransferase [Steroidobacteraceae bacterium]|nr:sulfotransferase [Steroidobacteraceae bacterium]